MEFECSLGAKYLWILGLFVEAGFEVFDFEVFIVDFALEEFGLGGFFDGEAKSNNIADNADGEESNENENGGGGGGFFGVPRGGHV